MISPHQWIHYSAPIKNKAIGLYGVPWNDAHDRCWVEKLVANTIYGMIHFIPNTHTHTYTCTPTHKHTLVQVVASGKLDLRIGRIEEKI